MTDLTPEGIELMQRYSPKDYKQGMCEDPEGDYLERSTVLSALAARATPAQTDNAALVESLLQWQIDQEQECDVQKDVEQNPCGAHTLLERAYELMDDVRAALSSRAAEPEIKA